MSGGRLEGRRSSVGGFKRGVWPGLGWGVGWLGLYFRGRSLLGRVGILILCWNDLTNPLDE